MFIMPMDEAEKIISNWLKSKNWKLFPFQEEAKQAILNQKSGLLNAPTGSGKTYALFIPFIIHYIRNYNIAKSKTRLIWISPLRALTKDIKKAMETMCEEIGLDISIASRTGDTSEAEKRNIKKNAPDVLITTPETLHIMLASKDHSKQFEDLEMIVIDEWHELLGNKRGVQVELALSRIKAIRAAQKSKLNIWGISATIGNLEQASEVLLGEEYYYRKHVFVKSEHEKNIEVHSVLPDSAENFSWAGHLGISLIDKVYPIIKNSKTTLLFTNTRAQAEIWYQAILDKYPEFAGLMAMHHGSLDNELRVWVEEALHTGQLKLVVCTSSLDLGVDFRPVDTIIQIGSPKGVARFMQRAGRSGHQPNAKSSIYFVPTHSLEIIEASAMRTAIQNKEFENRDPVILAYDVLTQYLLTLAVSDGFEKEKIFQEIKSCYAFREITENDFDELLNFITKGGRALSAYEEYNKVVVENNVYKIVDRKIARRHRLSMGTIVSDPSILIKYLSGGRIGTVEEWFVSKLKSGDHFWFAGKSLEFIQLKANTAYVKRSKNTKGAIPSWQGGRMPLSSQLSDAIRHKLDEFNDNKNLDEELKKISNLLSLQNEISILPASNQLLIEEHKSKYGMHLFVYPFEGRLVNEGLAYLLAYRISKNNPQSFSIAMNDYGFELLCDSELGFEEQIDRNTFSTKHLIEDIQRSLNATEMARRRFREISNIAGLVFNGYPGNTMSLKNIQTSSSLMFDMFMEYEPNHILIRQAFQEALYYQLEEFRLREALNRIQNQKIIYKKIEKVSPFCFPIMVDGLREKISTESLESKIQKILK